MKYEKKKKSVIVEEISSACPKNIQHLKTHLLSENNIVVVKCQY